LISTGSKSSQYASNTLKKEAVSENKSDISMCISKKVHTFAAEKCQLSILTGIFLLDRVNPPFFIE
jgi:hypothetical protein